MPTLMAMNKPPRRGLSLTAGHFICFCMKDAAHAVKLAKGAMNTQGTDNASVLRATAGVTETEYMDISAKQPMASAAGLPVARAATGLARNMFITRSDTEPIIYTQGNAAVLSATETEYMDIPRKPPAASFANSSVWCRRAG